jgi:hypothetical protein
VGVVRRRDNEATAHAAAPHTWHRTGARAQQRPRPVPHLCQARTAAARQAARRDSDRALPQEHVLQVRAGTLLHVVFFGRGSGRGLPAAAWMPPQGRRPRGMLAWRACLHRTSCSVSKSTYRNEPPDHTHTDAPPHTLQHTNINTQKLPRTHKHIAHSRSPAQTQCKRSPSRPEDLRIGGVINVHGRAFLVYGCDAATREWYKVRAQDAWSSAPPGHRVLTTPLLGLLPR